MDILTRSPHYYFATSSRPSGVAAANHIMGIEVYRTPDTTTVTSTEFVGNQRISNHNLTGSVAGDWESLELGTTFGGGQASLELTDT